MLSITQEADHEYTELEAPSRDWKTKQWLLAYSMGSTRYFNIVWVQQDILGVKNWQAWKRNKSQNQEMWGF